MTENTHSVNFIRVLGIALILLIGYALPWVVNTPTGLSHGAYDLAEWASLHPSVRASTPTLLTSLLLRLPLVMLAIVIGFAAPPQLFKTIEWWIAVVSVLILAAASLPPLEFITEARDDMNYQQQFILAVFALCGGFLGLTGVFRAWHHYVVILASIAGVLTALIGLNRAITLMQDFSLGTQTGIGFLIVLGAFIACLIEGASHIRKKEG